MSRRRAVLLMVVLLSASLGGCLSLDAAHVPNRYLEGPGGNGWERNETLSQDEPESASFGLTKMQTLHYQDRARSGDGFPGMLQATTLRTLFTPTEESLRDRLTEHLRNAAEARGIRIDGDPVSGSREVASGAESLHVVYNGTITDPGSIFTREGHVKILGEIWQCRAERTSVVVIGLAQITSGRNVGSIPLSNDADYTTWREIVADPDGDIEGHAGSDGLAYHVTCA